MIKPFKSWSTARNHGGTPNHDNDIGKSRGGLTSKIHAVTDVNGNAMHFIVTDGSVHDCMQARELLDSLVLGDRAFDTDKILDYIASKFAVAVIPSKKNRKVRQDYDRAVYRNRNQIERFFNRLI